MRFDILGLILGCLMAPVPAMAQPLYTVSEVLPDEEQRYEPGDISRKGWALVNVWSPEGDVRGQVCSPSGHCSSVPSPGGAHNPYATAYRISSDAAFVTGLAPFAGGAPHAIFFDGSQSVDIGTLADPDCDPGGKDPAPANCLLASRPVGVNHLGQVAGVSYRFKGGSGVRSFLWQSGVMREIGPFQGQQTEANSMNERGDVVGHYFATGSAPLPFIYRHGRLKPLPLPDGCVNGSAGSLNARGQFLLRATTDQGAEETYLHTEGLYSKVQPPPPFSNGSVTKLGEDGKIYGVYWNDEYGPVAYVFDGVDAYDLTDSIGAWRGVYFIQAIAGVNGNGQIITSAWHRIQHRWLAVVLTPLAIAATQ